MNMKITQCLMALAVGLGVANGQADPAQEMQARYQPNAVRVETNAQQEPSGLFSIRGPINLQLPVSASALAGASITRDRPQALAAQFFTENESVFDAKAEDLQLTKRSTDRFGTEHLRYLRVIDGIAIQDMEVLVHIAPDGTLSGVNGNIVRPSTGLVQHLQQRGDTPHYLSVEQALAKVAQLRSTDLTTLRLLRSELRLHNEAPHVRWMLDINSTAALGRFSYWLDAETGELISIDNTLRHPIPFSR